MHYPFRPVNLGNPEECRIRQLAEMILEHSGSSSKIVFRPLSQDEPVSRRSDIILAKQTLRWDLVVHIREGPARSIEYFRNVIGEMSPT